MQPPWRNTRRPQVAVRLPPARARRRPSGVAGRGAAATAPPCCARRFGPRLRPDRRRQTRAMWQPGGDRRGCRRSTRRDRRRRPRRRPPDPVAAVDRVTRRGAKRPARTGAGATPRQRRGTRADARIAHLTDRRRGPGKTCAARTVTSRGSMPLAGVPSVTTAGRTARTTEARSSPLARRASARPNPHRVPGVG